MPISLPRFQIIRVLLDHASDLPAIIAAVQAIPDADGIGGKWDNVKHLGDLLVPIVEEIAPYVTDGFAAAYDEQGESTALQASAASLGVDWSKLWAVLPQIISALELILPLVLGDKPLGSAG